MKRPQTNTELVQSIMEFSDHGALAQIFVIDALTKWSKIVADAPPIEHALISGIAWKAVAAEINQKLENRS